MKAIGDRSDSKTAIQGGFKAMPLCPFEHNGNEKVIPQCNAFIKSVVFSPTNENRSFSKCAVDGLVCAGQFWSKRAF